LSDNAPHTPATETDLAALIADAAAKREPVLVQGAGTKLGMLRPVQAARAVSTRGLEGVTLYSPKELVFGARAGTRLVDVQATLAEQGQHLIAEPPDYAALLGTEPGAQTWGGVVATNLSGPRRVAWGAVRDHVLGLRAIDGMGEIRHAGGRVLKNVTGLDICKLLTGSHGTLGVITEITVKVLPAPEATGSVVLAGLDAVRGVAALSAALGSPYGVSGAAWLPAEAAARLGFATSVALARIEDFAASVTYRLDRLRADLAPFGTPELLDEAASRAAWAAVRDATVLPAERGEAVWRVSVRPSRGPFVLAAAEAQGARGYLDWGGGLVMLAGPATSEAHAAITAAARAAAGVWMLLRAPEPLRVSVDVVPEEPAPLRRIAARVKAVMDPLGVLNPGRLGMEKNVLF
jgi:glycolate oxidase FAD binding subunit